MGNGILFWDRMDGKGVQLLDLCLDTLDSKSEILREEDPRRPRKSTTLTHRRSPQQPRCRGSLCGLRAWVARSTFFVSVVRSLHTEQAEDKHRPRPPDTVRAVLGLSSAVVSASQRG